MIKLELNFIYSIQFIKNLLEVVLIKFSEFSMSNKYD